MGRTRSFKFADGDLNRKLVALLRKASVEHTVDEGGAVHYAPEQAAALENDLICAVRDQVFSPWKIVTCPRAWVGRYRHYMQRHGIAYQEEWSNGKLWFLIPGKHRPHLWRLNGPAENTAPLART